MYCHVFVFGGLSPGIVSQCPFTSFDGVFCFKSTNSLILSMTMAGRAGILNFGC